MAVKPAYARPVCRIEPKLDNLTVGGKPRLDEGACGFAKKKWRFKPATQDGKAVAASLTANVVFQLK